MFGKVFIKRKGGFVRFDFGFADYVCSNSESARLGLTCMS